MGLEGTTVREADQAAVTEETGAALRDDRTLGKTVKNATRIIGRGHSRGCLGPAIRGREKGTFLLCVDSPQQRVGFV